jgi:hypothetical protein
MIVFSTVDGHLHKREYEFLFRIANELNIEKEVLTIHQELPAAHETDFQRVQQFTDWLI